MDKALNDLTGANLRGITLKERIGAGSMGDVWLGHDADLQLDVAVKILPDRHARDPFFVLSFVQEARAIARINHPNVVRVFQAGKRSHLGKTYRILVMELVRGRNLLDLIFDRASGGLEEDFVAEVALSVASGLRDAHRLGIVHRDIKPANIVISDADQSAKIIDFGIAWERSDQDRPEFEAGSTTYMAPELFGFDPVDHSIDIYALGISIFELLTGDPPFGGSANTVEQSHLEEAIELPRLDEAGVSHKWGDLIRLMCEKEASDRCSLKEVEDRLLEMLGRSSVSLTPVISDMLRLPPTNLIGRGTSFVGREAELEKIEALFEAGKPLVSVLGTGGVGKTRLVNEFGINATKYAGGTFFCDLTEAHDVASILAVVAGVLGLTMAEEAGSQVVNALRMRPSKTLLICDNFEHLIEFTGETIGSWLRVASKVDFLITSREPLHLEGEAPIVLSPLGYEAEGDQAALCLFEVRAASASGRFELNAANRADVAAICRQLDGIPLAIELAAARTTVLNTKQILERLPQRFDLLRSRRKNQSRRQMTLFATIQWSWDLLNKVEQDALMQCAIFHGGFFLEAAESVIDVTEGAESAFAIDIVESLVEKNLIAAEDVTALPSEMRYRLLESIRQFAELQWEQMLQDESKNKLAYLQARHADYYVEYGEVWAKKGRTHQGIVANRRLELEVENFLAIQDRFSKQEPGLAARAVLAAVEGLRNRGMAQVLLARLEQAFDGLDRSDPVLFALVSARLGYSQTDFGDLEKAESVLDTALTVSRDFKTSEELSARIDLLYSRAWLDRTRSEFDDAITRYAEAIELAAQIKDFGSLAKLLRSQAVVYSTRGEFDLAFERCNKALTVFRRLGDLLGQANTLSSLGTLCSRKGKHQDALNAYLKVAEMYKNVGDRFAVATIWGNIGVAYADLADNTRALKFYNKSEELFRNLGARAGVARNVSNRGNMMTETGRSDEAKECYRESEAIHRELNDKFGLALDIGNLASLHLELNEKEEAWDAFDEAEKMSRELEAPHLLRYWLHGKAEVASRWRKDPDEIIALAEESLKLFHDLKTVEDQNVFSCHAMRARGYWLKINCDRSSEHYEAVRAMAIEAQALGKKLEIGRTYPIGSRKGEKRPFWVWIDEILA